VDAADTNDTQVMDITDAIFVLGYLFLGTATPPPPGPSVPGIDPTDDDFPSCEAPSC